MENLTFLMLPDHDPIALRQIQREQYQHQLFGADKSKARNLASSNSVDSQLGETSESKDSNPSSAEDSRGFWRAQQIPNRIRRLRSRHGRNEDSKLWFVASNSYSFNSRCQYSRRFDREDLDENARQYYFYKSLPRIASTSLDPPPVSIFLGAEQEMPGTPPAKRAAAERQKLREQMLL